MRKVFGSAIIGASIGIIVFGVFCLRKAKQIEHEYYERIAREGIERSVYSMPWIYRNLMK